MIYTQLDPMCYSEETFGDLTAGILPALSTLRDGCAAFAEVKDDILADTSMTDDGQLLALDKLYEARVGRHIKAAETALLSSAKVMYEADKAIQEYLKPPSDPVGIALGGEMRQRLAAMTERDRTRTIEEAVQAGDRTLILAVLNGHPLLTGLSPEAGKVLRDRYLAANAPELHTRHERAAQLMKIAQHGLDALPTLRQLHFKLGTDERLKGIRERNRKATKYFE